MRASCAWSFVICCALMGPARAETYDPAKLLPAEQLQTSRDYGQDLLALFSWALNIRFTPEEQRRFIYERQMEWVSGHNVWQCAYISHYWTLQRAEKALVDANKKPTQEMLLDFIQQNAKAGAADMIWIQKRLGDDEVTELPRSQARRSRYESMPVGTAVATAQRPGLLDPASTMLSRLEWLAAGNALGTTVSMLQLPLGAAERDEYMDRLIDNWRKSPEDWSATASRKAIIPYVNNSANRAVYEYNTPHNLAQLNSFVERGDRDAKWLRARLDKAFHDAPLGATGLTRSVFREYSLWMVKAVNEVAGKRMLTPDIEWTIRMQEDALKNWASFDEAKRQMMLDGVALHKHIAEYYPVCAPLKKAHMRLGWLQHLVKSNPGLKPAWEAYSREFAQLAKANANWEQEMEADNKKVVEAYMARKQKEYDGMMANLNRIWDGMNFSSKMRQLSNAIASAPAGTSVSVTIRP